MVITNYLLAALTPNPPNPMNYDMVICISSIVIDMVA